MTAFDHTAHGVELVAGQFGKYIAVPWGEPAEADERQRVFDTEDEARDYAFLLWQQLTLDDPRAHGVRPFVTVLWFRDDAESREEARLDAADGMGEWPLHTPCAWVDDRGYVAGSWEDSAYLFGEIGEPYDSGEQVELAHPQSAH